MSMRRTNLWTFGAFLCGAVPGSLVAFSRLCSELPELRMSTSEPAFSNILSASILPLLPVLFLGTSTLGSILIPLVSFLRGFSFSFASTVLLRCGSLSRLATELGIPGIFYLTAFFLACQQAESESHSFLRLPQSTGTRQFFPIYLLLLTGAAFRIFSHTLY